MYILLEDMREKAIGKGIFKWYAFLVMCWNSASEKGNELENSAMSCKLPQQVAYRHFNAVKFLFLYLEWLMSLHKTQKVNINFKHHNEYDNWNVFPGHFNYEIILVTDYYRCIDNNRGCRFCVIKDMLCC